MNIEKKEIMDRNRKTFFILCFVTALFLIAIFILSLYIRFGFNEKIEKSAESQSNFSNLLDNINKEFKKAIPPKDK